MSGLDTKPCGISNPTAWTTSLVKTLASGWSSWRTSRSPGPPLTPVTPKKSLAPWSSIMARSNLKCPWNTILGTRMLCPSLETCSAPRWPPSTRRCPSPGPTWSNKPLRPRRPPMPLISSPTCKVWNVKWRIGKSKSMFIAKANVFWNDKDFNFQLHGCMLIISRANGAHLMKLFGGNYTLFFKS